jgi:hypothetical protein
MIEALGRLVAERTKRTGGDPAGVAAEVVRLLGDYRPGPGCLELEEFHRQHVGHIARDLAEVERQTQGWLRFPGYHHLPLTQREQNEKRLAELLERRQALVEQLKRLEAGPVETVRDFTSVDGYAENKHEQREKAKRQGRTRVSGN